MKICKKLILTFLLSMMTLILSSLSASALTEGDWEFTLLDNEVTVTGYLGTDKDVVIPSTIYGAPVTKVDCEPYGIFFGNPGEKNVVSLTIPDSVKELGTVVRNQYTLEMVDISDSVEMIPDVAFMNCDKLKTVKLPAALKHIGQAAFGYTALESIEFPPTLENIGKQAFEYCDLTSLDLSACTSLDLSDSYETFLGCDKLKSVTLPSTIKQIARSFFCGCTSLETVDFNGALIECITDMAFARCSSLKSIILPTTVKKIDSSAFTKSGLVEIVIPYGVEEIGYDVFSLCENLKSIYVPDTATKIEKSAFSSCPNAIVYCNTGSKAESICKDQKYSYLTDKSVNTGINVLYNGTRISFHAYDQNPELINNRTLVPLRSIFEAMGADVEWVGETSTVIATRNGVKITLQIGSNTVVKNNENITIDTPPMLLNDRTMVPVRVIAEAFGADVNWIEVANTVIITE